METVAESKGQKWSAASIIAVVAAVGSFFVGAFWGLILAVVALVFGVIGMIAAMSPRVRGGIASVIALLAAGLGIVAALVKGVMWVAG